ncbi:MAG: helix-turn-helix transcriptional regulator [Terriglobales bacterium]
MQPRDRLTAKEVQVATLVWQGLTNKDIAGVLRTSEQVVKNYLRTAFDKLGVWTRLELALYVAGHGGANWHLQLGNGLLPVEEGLLPVEKGLLPVEKGWRTVAGEEPQLARSHDSRINDSRINDSRITDSRSSEKRSAGGALL